MLRDTSSRKPMLISQAKVTSNLSWQFTWSSCLISEISLRFSPLQDVQPSSPAHPGNRPLRSGLPFPGPTWCLAQRRQNARVLDSPEEAARVGHKMVLGNTQDALMSRHSVACEWYSVKAISFLIVMKSLRPSLLGATMTLTPTCPLSANLPI